MYIPIPSDCKKNSVHIDLKPKSVSIFIDEKNFSSSVFVVRSSDAVV